jgi:hypothetical protein
MGLDGDPSTAIGCDGTAYSVNLSSVGRNYLNQTQVYRSKDGGKTWLPPIVLSFSDREYIVVDCTSSKYRGRVYIHGNGAMRAADGVWSSATRIFKSEDGGQTFREWNFPPPADRRSTYQGIPVVLSDGTLVAPFADMPYDLSKQHDRGGPVIRVFVSEDGANSFAGAYTLSNWTPPAATDIGLPNLAVDQSSGPFRNQIYAVWADSSSGRSEIMLAHSRDKGKTWTIPIIVNDDLPFTDGRNGPDDIMGVAAVNKDGVLGVSWYDRRDSRNDYDWTVRFAASFDGGHSFQRSVKVSEASFVHNWAKSLPVSLVGFAVGEFDDKPGGVLKISTVPDRSFFHGGDTAGLVADAEGLFHPLWVDNRTGVAQVWTTTIKVNGKAIRNGSTELADLDDISGKVTLKFGDTQYDPGTKTVSGQAFLVNTSDDTLLAPLVVRVLGFENGTPEIVDADNHQSGQGALWDFSSVVPGNKLEPGKTSRGKHIEFTVASGIQLPSRSDKPGVWPFLGINAEALGKVEGAHAHEK